MILVFMKKRITRPDGTIEEVEGTAEELAQLEKAVVKKAPKKESKLPSRRILNDQIQRLIKENEELKQQLTKKSFDDFWKRLQEEVRRQEEVKPYLPSYPNPQDYPVYPWTVRPNTATRSWLNDDTFRVPLELPYTFCASS